MTSKQVSKVRLVKCPKCRRLLAELAELPVYECGGCGTVLQAKIRTNELKIPIVDLPETDIIPPKELANATEDKGSSSTSHNLNLLPVDCNNWNGQNESPKDKLEVSNFPTDTSSSAELTFHENADSSSIPVPPVQEQIDQSQTIDVLGHDRVRSTDTSDTELMNSSSDLSDMLEEMHVPKSPNTGSTHAYEGSASSCDGTVDQVPSYPPLQVYTTYEDADSASVQERLVRERGKFPMNDMSGNNVEVQDQARNSISSNKTNYTMNYSDRSRNQPPKHPRHSNQMRFDDDDDESLRVPPFYLKNGSPSSHWHDEFQGSSSVCSPENPMNYSQEKIKLLRMVYKLQDQLDRAHIDREQTMLNVPTGGTYYSHEASREQIYHNLGNPRYPRTHREGEEWSHHSRSSQMPFSGEVTNWGGQGDHPYLHCYCCNIEGRVNLGHNCYSGNNPRPSVHQPWMDSKVPLQDSYTKSDNLGRQKFHMREKNHMVKKHYRPISGGAPFITCYLCFKPLQLPADFLSYRRKCHKLKCGACSMVLKFSLENGNHILPFASSYDPVEQRKKTLPPNQALINRYKTPVKSYEEAGPSNRLDRKKRSPEADEMGRNSPLHRLMGYTSANEILNGSD